jgi:iron complex outermembrane receptor protein
MKSRYPTESRSLHLWAVMLLAFFVSSVSADDDVRFPVRLLQYRLGAERVDTEGGEETSSESSDESSESPEETSPESPSDEPREVPDEGPTESPDSSPSASPEETRRELAEDILRRLRALPGPAETSPTRDVTTPVTTEVTGLLEQAPQVQTVSARQSSPLAVEPIIRGFKGGQVYSQADGTWLLPVRPDLDAQLSRLDPALVESPTVIPGPYGLRYGPGFSFLDIVTTPAPRYECGPEIHSRIGLTSRTNGGQFFGRATLFGGTDNRGFIFSYANRLGSDYRSGNGTRIPSSYHDQNLLGQIGIDLTPSSKLEVRYRRVEQWDVENAAQIFDVRSLDSEGIAISLLDTSPYATYQRLRVEGWYNRSWFDGDTLNGSKRSFHVIDRIEAALASSLGQAATFSGFTDGDVLTSGARFAATHGEEDWLQWTIGADMRYAEQHLQERFDIVPTGGGATIDVFTNMPRAWQYNPGLFVEASAPFLPFWTTTMGGRYDAVGANARKADLRSQTSLQIPEEGLSQNENMYSFFWSNDIEIAEYWTARASFGHAQRPPTLVERYADGIFLGIIQSGFSRVIGAPTLPKERLWQLDLGTTLDFDRLRTRGRWFYSWVKDYSTYEANVIADPVGARLLRSTNTRRATLTGFEVYGEVELNPVLDGFGSLGYVRGQDEEIGEPLPAIAPLEGRAGLRLHDADERNNWHVEFGARMVDGQHRFASLRAVGLPTTIPLETPTPGFTVFYLRGTYRANDQLRIAGGIDNLFDRNYLEHLSLRYAPQGAIPATEVFSPGITPYLVMEWTH